MKRVYYLLPILMLGVISCEEDYTVPLPPKGGNNTTVRELPEREYAVYWGTSRWDEMTTESYAQDWEYVRKNMTGMYVNFISMWQLHYQTSGRGAQLLSKLYDNIDARRVFFETSMEKAVNAGVNGFNNDISDKRTVDYLTTAGFTVDYTSLNYMSVKEEDVADNKYRIQLLQNYKGTRECLSLHGPWNNGGDIFQDVGKTPETNRNARTVIDWTDGMQTDGPLGFWFVNQGKMRESSYSLVKYVVWKQKTSAVMLAPYGAGVAGYDQMTDYLTVSKQCVFDHEDNNAQPDLWTIWNYQSGALQMRPEMIPDQDGHPVPQNTLTGVCYWLLRHLSDFPVVKMTQDGVISDNVAVIQEADDVYTVEMKKGVTYEMPIDISNDDTPHIELSPIVRAVTDVKNVGWEFSFKINNRDVTQEILYDGGLNCIRDLRLSSGNRLTLKVSIKALPGVKAGTTLSFQTMSSLSNTKEKKTPLTVNLLAL